MKFSGFLFFLSVIGVLSCQTGLDRDSLVARVNGSDLDVRELENALVRMGHFPGVDLSKKEARVDVVKKMIDEELLFQEALKEELYKKSTEIKKVMVREYLNLHFGQKKMEVSKAEIEQLFKNRKNQIEKIRARHILVDSQEKAKAIYAQLKSQARKNGLFESLAKEHSTDKASAKNGGDLGLFSRGKMVPAFEKVAFSLKKVGDLSEPVKSKFGYHIIQLTGDQRGLAFHGPMLKKYIANQKKKKAVDSFLAMRRASSEIKMFPENVMKASVAPKIDHVLPQ